MSKNIDSKIYDDGLNLCEENGLKFYSLSVENRDKHEYLTAFLFGVVSFEEFVKAHMILDSYNEPCISGSKWKKKMKDHHAKIKYGAELLKRTLRESAQKLIDKGVPEQSIITDIDIVFTKKYVDDVVNNRTSFIYVDYDPDNECWISPEKASFEKAEEIRNAAASLGVLITWRKIELNI